LKEELELIKASKKSLSNSKTTKEENSHNAEVAGHDNIGSYINRIYMKSSMFWLYIITGVLSYAHKLPYIREVIGLLSLWYGKTTIWKILIKVRRIFIVFNALIGVMLVFKTTGFSSDNILAGFTGMGYTYIEILTNFTKRLFHWFVELFDHKVVPNVPGDTGGYFSNTKPSLPKNKPLIISSGINVPDISDKFFSLRELYKDATPGSHTAWYKEWSTYLWIIGIVSVAFIGYKFIIDPLFVESLPSYPSGPKGKGVEIPSPDTPTPSNFTNTPFHSKIFSSISWLGGSTFKGLKMLNPLYWLPNSSDIATASEAFMNHQVSQNYDNRYYPFTEVHPYNPWYTKLRLYLLGETSYEYSNRMHFKREVLNGIMPPISESSRITSSIPSSPSVGNLGLTFGVNSGDAIEASSSFFKTATKFNSLPNTPKLAPLNIPVETLEGGTSSWKYHTQLNNIVDRVLTTPNISESTNIPPKELESATIADKKFDDLPYHDAAESLTPNVSNLPLNNKYELLTEVNI
jgi:hypothetical protein